MFPPAARIIPLILLCWLPAALAGAPATQPEIPAQGAATDAFRSFLLDIQQGNPDAIPDLCSARDETARGLVQDFQSVAAAMKYLRAAAALKFGNSAVDAIAPALPTLDDLDDVTETVTGDRAQLSGGAVWPMHMIKSAGRWKLDLDWLAQSDDMPANPHWFGAMARAIHRTADDIASGKLASVADAALAMQAREQAIPDSVATAPSTQP